MKNRNFRLNVEGLDERTLPSVTPDMVHTAMVQVAFEKDEIAGVAEKMGQPQTARTLAFLPTHMRQAADASIAAFNILADQLASLQTELKNTTDPARAAALREQSGQVAMAEYQAYANTIGAEFLALAYGAPLRTTPGSDGTDNGINFGSTALPFSLTDPSWQAVPNGNGVRTWDVVPGTGTALANGSTFTAKYTGYLTDGTVFDSGTLNNSTVGTGLITGFSTGLVGMKVGGTRRIDIPASQAYGANPPSGSKIPPNAELVFEVQLQSSP